MDTIIPDVDNTSSLIEGALPILHIPEGEGVGRPAIVEALARLNALDKMMAAGYVFTREQVERLGWPAGTHIDWIPLQQSQSSPQSSVMEQRVAALERYLNRLYRYFGLIA